ncbi:hypothetical protein ACWIG5_34035 [Streptomyces lydicus]
MMSNAKIGLALVGGYLLGRTKKAKMAIGLGMFLAGRKLNLDPRQLGALVADSPLLGPLNDQVRKELVDATKSAAGAALNQRINGLADSLHERTLALDEGGGTDGSGRAADQADPEPYPAPEPEGKGKGRDEARESATKRTTKSATKSAREPATKSASAENSTAADRSSTARRSASSAARTSGKAASSRGRTSTAPGRKAASSTRNKASNKAKASGAARTAAGRGGSNG